MRRFFSFRSSSSCASENQAPSNLTKNKKEADSGISEENNERIEWKKNGHCDLQTPEDLVLKPLNPQMDTHLRRSLSFSSADIRWAAEVDNFTSESHQSRKTSFHGDDDRLSNSQSSPTPERYTRINRVHGERVQKSKAFEQTGSPSSCGGYQNSSGNSISSSSIHLRCRASRLSQVSSNNNLLDLYIDGEHHATESMTNSQRYAEIGDDEHIAESMRPTSSGRPPRYLCTAPSSPRYGTDNLRSYSFREIRGKYPKYASSHKHTENNLDSMTCEFPGKLSMSDIRGFDGETTTTIEDIYQDSSDGCPTLSSNGITKDFSVKVIPLSKGFDSHQTDQNFDVSKKACFPDRFYWASVHGELVGSTMKEQHTDEWLLKKVEELDKTYHLFEEDPEPEKLEHDRLNITTLLKNIRKITEDKRHLASELSLQIISRLKERSFAKEHLSQLKLELDTRTRRLEKEKNELQSSLEKELDRRSMEWSLKLSKFQSEEQRLRDRVRELAEQNVALQREVSSFKGIEPEMRNSITNLERQLNDCRTNQDELKTENYNLRQASMELQESCNKAEEERNYITNICKEKERESKDLQKVVVRLQRTCSEQEKTIEELGQSFSNEIGKPFIIGDNVINQPQAEKLRLASVELNLRREVETCRIELESLRKENICLLERFRCAAGNRYGFSLARLDLELHARVECLEMQSLSLLDDSSNFCNQLLDCAGRCHLECCCMESNASAHVYSAIEPSLRHQKLRKAIENYRRSLQMISTTLDEKLGLATEASSSMQQKVQKTEDVMEVELKAEAILTRVLKEKIFSKEVEIEQLQDDFASSVRSYDLLQAEVQMLRDEVSRLTHKKKDMEIQMMTKDENVNQLQRDIQECTKDLGATRGMLTSISEERDHMWEEVKQLRERNMLMDCELKSLHKKIEVLDEDLLYKEGQISILQDSLGNKQFDIICNPSTIQELSMQ